MITHRLKIKKLGPIEECELTCSKFMTLTGFQASGKSTVAKAVYYFRTVKDDIYDIVEQRAAQALQNMKSQNINLVKELMDVLRKKFLQLFGSSWGMDQDMKLEYYYTEDCYISISLKEENVYPSPNYIWIELSDKLKNFLARSNNALSSTTALIPEQQKLKFRSELQEFFDDRYSVVYIPAGRSMLTLLAQQLSYIYTIMDESLKRTLDYCTQKYIENILKIKPEFSDGLIGLMAYNVGNKRSTLEQALKLINKILRGSYRADNDNERIMLENGKYVKINFASSGQQEAVWILNLLFYCLVQDRPYMLIIEEPESHLFPETQKDIVELITLVANNGHSMLVTTHSPYVLGTLNNLLYAGSFKGSEKKEQASKRISNLYWLDYRDFNAWFVRDGKLEDCMDSELHLIQNEKIDEISDVINQDYDYLFELRHGGEMSDAY